MHSQRLEKLKRLWPVGLCWLLMMLGDGAASYFIESGGSRHDVALTAIIGFFFGQLGLAAILGGLVGRTWLSGWLLAVLLTVVAAAVCVLGALPHASGGIPERIAIAALAPTLTLAACAPLILMRGLRGWSLTLGKQTSIVKERAGVEDLLLLSVAVACSLSWLRVVSTFSRSFSEMQHGMVMAATFFGFSLLLVVPATAVTFRARSWWKRLLGWTGIAVAACTACMVMNAVMTPGFGSAVWRTLGWVVLNVGACSLTMALGACAILASGFKLTRFATITGPAQDEAEESEAIALSRSTRRQARLWTGAVVCGTLLVSSWLSYMNYRQVEFLESVQRGFADQGPYAGGSVAITDDKVTSVTVAKDTTDDTFYRYMNFRDLQRLSLAHSRVTDRTVPELTAFPALRILDLSDTAISDIGLEHLRKNVNLNELAVAKTRVSARWAFEAARSIGVNQLDVSELGVSDEDLQFALNLERVQKLALRGNPITDKGIAELIQLPPNRLLCLDLSNTAIDGSGLISGNCPSVLILDGTKITDANLIAIMKANPGITVSIKNTATTAQVLSVANATQVTLLLGGGKITERDLVNLGPAGFSGLGLNGPEFTGACLGNFAQAQWLDLSHSGVTDAALLRLKNAGGAYFSSLNLAHTQVTDASLPIIVHIGYYELDLRHTKITAEGLLQNQLPGRRIIVDYDQFTPAELVALRQRFEVSIGGQSIFLPRW